MNGQKIPTFHMGQKDTIGEEATVICVWIGDRMHVLTNEASIRIKAAIVDCEMSEMRHYFANDATQGWFSIGGGDKPLIARKWRGHVFVWSFANNIWQLADSHTNIKAQIADMKTRGCKADALTKAGQSFLR